MTSEKISLTKIEQDFADALLTEHGDGWTVLAGLVGDRVKLTADHRVFEGMASGFMGKPGTSHEDMLAFALKGVRERVAAVAARP